MSCIWIRRKSPPPIRIHMIPALTAVVYESSRLQVRFRALLQHSCKSTYVLCTRDVVACTDLTCPGSEITITFTKPRLFFSRILFQRTLPILYQKQRNGIEGDPFHSPKHAQVANSPSNDRGVRGVWPPRTPRSCGRESVTCASFREQNRPPLTLTHLLLVG